MAAEFATPQSIAFFLQHTSGVICATVTSERARELALGPMVQQNTESQRTAFLVTVDYRHGTTTGISAADRAATIKALVDPATRPDDLLRPGPHLPARGPRGRRAEAGRAHRGGRRPRPHGRLRAGRRAVRDRQRTTATTWPGGPELEEFCAQHGLLMISIADMIRHRRAHREARAPGRRRRRCRRRGASSTSSPSSRCSTAAATWRSCAATSPAPTPRSCACTASA